MRSTVAGLRVGAATMGQTSAMPGPAAVSPVTIRVATYNLYLGADLTVVFGVESREELAEQARHVLDQVMTTDFPARAETIAALLVRDRVDVVGLQEVARWSGNTSADALPPRVWLDFLTVLLDALERAGERYEAHAVAANFHGSATVEGAEITVLGHNVILVRRGSGIRVSGAQVGDFSPVLKITTGTPDVGFEVARSWSSIEAEAGGRVFRFVSTHLEAWDEGIRDQQRDELVAALRGTRQPLVLVGDFNSTPDRVGMPDEYVDAWQARGKGDGMTSGRSADLAGERDELSARIDYVWARGARVEACWVVGADERERTGTGLWPSDHAGVVAEVTL
jgi:hypothetical protein